MNHYTSLGLDRTATSADIKKAYRKLAKIFHPDFHQDDPSYEDRFKEISEAYYVLSDADRKYWYDKQLDEPQTFYEEAHRQHTQTSTQYRSMYVENSDVPYYKWKMAGIILFTITLLSVMVYIFKPWDVPGQVPKDALILQVNNASIEIYPQHPYYNVLKKLLHTSLTYEDVYLYPSANELENYVDSLRTEIDQTTTPVY